jgi:enamine deaminase RidA (YjgF/YER057c/UK114 family)
MTIERIRPEPRMSDVVIHNDTIYYTAVPENLDANAKDQTAETLAIIDAVLTEAGSDKSKILDATLFLVHKEDFQAMNESVGRVGFSRQCAGALHGAGQPDEPEI